MKFIRSIFFASALFFASTLGVMAQESHDVVINLFYSNSCPHCAHAAPFLENLANSNSRVRLRAFEVSGNRANAILFQLVGEKLNLQIGGVPFILIGKHPTTGYLDDETSGKELARTVETCLADWSDSCEDQVAEFLEESIESEDNSPATVAAEPSQDSIDQADDDSETQVYEADKEVSLPLFGNVNLKDLSLPAVTFVLALLDGFNPCAMWTLVFLISLLLGMKDRKRMWLLGVTFILASGLVYFLFLSAWLNLFLFLGLVTWVRLIIAVVALGAGIYSLYDYQTNKDAACKVTHTNQRQKVFTRLKELVKQQHLFVSLVGITLLAFTVNIVELFCSAGLPAVYTQILSLSALSTWKYYAYLVFYVLIFMIDDLFVFVTAMVTLKMTGIEHKYAHLSRLIGGILMLIIGLLLIFKPNWLMFG